MKAPTPNQQGQMSLEMLCLMIVFLGVGLTAQKYIVTNGWATALVQGPWSRVQGMIEDGVWVKAGPSKAFHPSLMTRHGSLRGDDTSGN